MLNIVPCPIQWDLVVYFIYGSLYVRIPNHSFLPCLCPSAMINLFSMSVSLELTSSHV